MGDKPQVYLVGAGAGCADTLTLKAHALITDWADIIVVDRLVANDIISLIPDNVTVIYAGKAPGNAYFTQEEINECLYQHAKQGYNVVRLKGGDPFIYGRGGEELAYLKQREISVKVIPGISAFQVAAAEYHIPLTFRDLSMGITIISGHTKNGLPQEYDWHALAQNNHSLILYMSIRNIKYITDKLIENGLDKNTPSIVIEQAGLPAMRKIQSSLHNISAQIVEHKILSPAIIIIGKVANENLYKSDLSFLTQNG